MSNRTTSLLVLATLLLVITGLSVAFSLWRPAAVPVPEREGRSPRAETSPPREIMRTEPETAPAAAALPDLPMPTTQAEAEALQRDAVRIAGS